MKPPRFWIALLTALALPAGDILLGSKPLPPDPSPAGTATVPDSQIPGLPSSSYLEGHRGENNAEVESVRQKIRAARRSPDLPALLALSNNDQALWDVAQTMSPAQCQTIFQQAMLKGGCWMVADFMLGSLVERKVKGQAEEIARWLMAPSNHFPEPRDARTFASTVITEWSRSEPRAAADFAANVPLNKDDVDDPLSQVLTAVCAEWAHDDPIGSWNWSETLPDTDPRKVYALIGTMYVFNDFDSDKAKAWVARLIGVNEQTPRLSEVVAANLTQRELSNLKEPRAAIKWVLSIPDTSARRAALKSVINSWIPSGVDSISQAKQWAASLPPDEVRGAAWGALAIAWESCDNRLVELAGGTPEFFQQLKINGKAADNWLRSLPAGADRDEAIAIREKFETSILNQRTWR